MSRYIEFTRVPDYEMATEYTSLFEKNDIPFVLDDSFLRYKLGSTESPYDNQIIINVKEEDLSKAKKLLSDEIDCDISEISPDHYLYTFDDGQVIDIIANQTEWSAKEVKIALKIAQERSLDLSFDNLAKAKKTNKPQNYLKSELSKENTSGWINTFGLFSILNSLFFRINVNFHLPGFASTELMEYFFAAKYGGFTTLGFLITLLIVSGFFFLAKLGKHNNWIFLSGLTLLFLDTLLRAYTGKLFFVLFYFIALLVMASGFINDLQKRRQRGKI